MSNYVHFAPEEKQQAHEANIEELLRREGETLKRSGTELQWGDGSNKVTIRGNTWYHQYEQVRIFQRGLIFRSYSDIVFLNIQQTETERKN